MKTIRLSFIVLGVTLISQMLLIQCESPKKAVREESDESGKESTWNADIRENADEMLEKGRAVFRFETFGDEADERIINLTLVKPHAFEILKYDILKAKL